ncbi:hypothetical protein C8Q76DRAFT_802000 [Earliella scabrosa]|nr:hypothetical protein C8Q76DRAFT_803260 [Earliella scabrosa]KAI0703159.1 hypothetical protein C8Q76DRAFT_802000 [Earliella scabrosa]
MSFRRMTMLDRGKTTLSEFSDRCKSCADFKSAILKEYVGADGRLLYTVEDVEDLVSSTAQAGFRTSTHFIEYKL